MPRTAQQKSNTRRGRPRLETQRTLYQIKLSGWDFTWSFSLALPNNSRANEGHYHEHMILTLKGEVFYPESFKYPGRVPALCRSSIDAKHSPSKRNRVYDSNRDTGGCV